MRLFSMVALATALVGCSQRELAVDPVIPTYSRESGSMTHLAEAEGELAQHGRCLVLIGTDGQERLLAFPMPGTRWDASSRTVSVYDKPMPVGHMVAVAGGEFDAPAASDWLDPPARECERSKVWLVESVEPIDKAG